MTKLYLKFKKTIKNLLIILLIQDGPKLHTVFFNEHSVLYKIKRHDCISRNTVKNVTKLWKIRDLWRKVKEIFYEQRNIFAVLHKLRNYNVKK